MYVKVENLNEYFKAKVVVKKNIYINFVIVKNGSPKNVN